MMKKAAMTLVLLLCVSCLIGASALSLTVPTDSSVKNVMIMDESGKQLGIADSFTNTSGGKEWSITIANGFSGWANVYELGADGTWVPTKMIYVETSSGPSVSAPKWPQVSLSGRTVYVYPLPDDKRYQSFAGPSRSYHGAGGYKTYKIESIQALFIEDGYVFVDMYYTTVGRRRLYFQSKIFESLSGVPTQSWSGYSAKTTASVTPRFGPGNQYDDFEEAAISSGKSLQVFFEENGWVFAEFDTSKLGPVRAWIPASIVE